MSMHLKLTNSIDSNCVGRQNNKDNIIVSNTILDCIEDSIGKVWEHL